MILNCSCQGCRKVIKIVGCVWKHIIFTLKEKNSHSKTTSVAFALRPVHRLHKHTHKSYSRDFVTILHIIENYEQVSQCDPIVITSKKILNYSQNYSCEVSFKS